MKCDLLLKEGDILGVARRILPVVNLALSKTRALFSGETSMTLKVTTNKTLRQPSMVK
ncbi:unnamed protein product [Malus baccata var. baccata]